MSLHGIKVIHNISEILIRLSLWISFIYMERCEPFKRIILPEELWMYKFPITHEYVPASVLWLVVVIIPLVVITIDYLHCKNKIRYKKGVLCLTLLLGLNGFVTVFIKLLVGRPRPDFYFRCFPNGNGNNKLECNGDNKNLMEGRKSFPSGHSSFSFSAMVFVSLLLNDKLQPFNRYRGETWKLICCLIPLLLSTAIAISRTCDYHHHWQDVTVGGILGSIIAYVCYHQYYSELPSSTNTN